MRAALLLMFSCGQATPTEPEEDPTPRCDGVRQELEETTDAPFDQDGDGFFDRSDSDCVSAWRPDQLDCDDEDPAVNPSAFEITCDGLDNDCRDATPDNEDVDDDGFGRCEDCNDAAPDVFPGNHETCFDDLDNDCDGITDNDCGHDPNGSWQVDHPVSVVCQPVPFLPAFVDIDVDEISILSQPPHLNLSFIGATMPPSMNGISHPDGSFEVEMTVGLLQPGICQERYSLVGSFTGETTLEAVFSYEFVDGSPASCGGCNLTNTHHITATKL